MSRQHLLEYDEVYYWRTKKNLSAEAIGMIFSVPAWVVRWFLKKHKITGKCPPWNKGEEWYSKPANRRARELGYETLGEFIVDMKQKNKTVEDIVSLSGLSKATILRYTPENIKGKYPITPKVKERLVKQNLNRNNERHIWRSLNSAMIKKT
jgi:hypothetical protein